MEIAEGMIKDIFAKCKNITFTKPFRRMTWTEAMNRFGSDKPDTRYGLELNDISPAVKNSEFTVFRQALEKGSVRALCVKGGADKFTRKEIDAFADFVKDYGAKGLAWASKKNDGSTTSTFYKFLTEEEIKKYRRYFCMPKKATLSLSLPTIKTRSFTTVWARFARISRTSSGFTTKTNTTFCGLPNSAA